MWSYTAFTIYILPAFMFMLLMWLVIRAIREYRHSDQDQKKQRTRQLILSSMLTILFISGFLYYLTSTT